MHRAFLAHHQKSYYPSCHAIQLMEGSVRLAVLCPILSFSLWKEVTLLSTSICKPYIFHKSDLVNTERIITAILKPLIFSFSTVGLMEEDFSAYGNTFITNQCCCPQNKLSRQQQSQVRQQYQQPIKSYGGDLGVHKTN